MPNGIAGHAPPPHPPGTPLEGPPPAATPQVGEVPTWPANPNHFIPLGSPEPKPLHEMLPQIHRPRTRSVGLQVSESTSTASQ